MSAGHHHLAVLLPGGSPEAAALRARGYRPAEMGLTLVGRSFRDANDLAWLAPRFAFTCGDFDLV